MLIIIVFDGESDWNAVTGSSVLGIIFFFFPGRSYNPITRRERLVSLWHYLTQVDEAYFSSNVSKHARASGSVVVNAKNCGN